MRRKLLKQMRRGDWTEKMIREAMLTPGIAMRGKKGPATRHVHPTSGCSVIVDNATGEIFHLGRKEFEYE